MPKHMTGEEHIEIKERSHSTLFELSGGRRFTINVQAATKKDKRAWRKLYRHAVNWCGVVWGGKR